jgi:hypothetical protein
MPASDFGVSSQRFPPRAMATEIISANDGFVLAMLTMMALSLGLVAMLFFCMRKNGANRNRQVEELLEEVAAEEKRDEIRKSDPSPPAEPWERNADWWKS